MDTARIKYLLDKYYKAETTLKEENEIREYFNNNKNIPKEFQTLKDQFILYSYLSKPLPDELNDKFENIIDEKASGSISINRQLILRYCGLAASILIMVGVIFLLMPNKNKIEPNKQEIELAYEYSKKTLLYVSSKLNKGTSQLHNVKKMNTGTHYLNSLSKFDSELEHLQYLSKIDENNNKK